MNKIIILIGLLIIGTLLLSQNVDSYNSKEIQINDFSYLEISGITKVYYEQGQYSQLFIYATEEKYLDEITIKQNNNELVISDNFNISNTSFFDLIFNNKSKNNNDIKDDSIIIKISSPNLAGIKISGSVEFYINNKLNTNEFYTISSGASNIVINNITANEIVLENSGASDITITGNTTDLYIKSSGASDIKANELSCQNAYITASGASDLRTKVQTYLQANLSGASSLEYYGNPNVKKVTSGASEVTKVN
ncbi:MAG: DUF2807 domain-containing protein [Candidatus Cloacimonetes bacterium]|nr:DUF2807 domain-containing protein [Candidatus Cloacimonadota bacterium]MDD4155025.1 DUF2807 domain-containing protein [Candidatus Cloacimonadota bacterium]